MTQRDKDIVRELAKRYMEHATDEKQQDMNERMRATNDLKIVRPPVLIDEIPWFEMDIDNELTCRCEDPEAIKVETFLRQGLFRRKYFKADTLFEPFYRVKMGYDASGIGIQVKESTKSTNGANHIISHSYEDVFEEDGSAEKIKIPTFRARPDRDARNMELLTDLLGDAMPVKLCGRGYLYHAPWDRIARYRGMEAILYDFYDRPEHLHAIRQKFLEMSLAEIDFVEKELHVDNEPSLHCTPGMISGLAEDGWKATWLRTMAQGFSEVSPEMHEEFELPYVLALADRFAYTYYGCCEPLNNKLDVIFKIPNLRKVGVSPWAKEEIMAERLGGNYVYARKPSPAHVALVTDPEVIRRETEKTVKICQQYGCPVEFVLKDISTVSGRPENLIVWANTVSDVLDEYYGK